jgi:hypothetical protein
MAGAALTPELCHHGICYSNVTYSKSKIIANSRLKKLIYHYSNFFFSRVTPKSVNREMFIPRNKTMSQSSTVYATILRI